MIVYLHFLARTDYSPLRSIDYVWLELKAHAVAHSTIYHATTQAKDRDHIHLPKNLNI